ncbi:MAG: hypothetical protein V3U23_06285 [Kiloniellales bacterium]
MTIFTRLVRPLDEHLSEDQRAVTQAAGRLRVGEFDLFRLAYRRWHHREAEEKALEKIFARYLFQREAAPWVRQFCREVLARARAGSLDPAEFGADTVPRREPFVSHRHGFAGLAFMVTLIAYLLYTLLR